MLVVMISKGPCAKINRVLLSMTGFWSDRLEVQNIVKRRRKFYCKFTQPDDAILVVSPGHEISCLSLCQTHDIVVRPIIKRHSYNLKTYCWVQPLFFYKWSPPGRHPFELPAITGAKISTSTNRKYTSFI